MRRLDSFQERTDTAIFAGAGNIISQTFRARNDGLAGIRLVVYNPRLGGQGKYQLILKDEKNRVIWQDFISESSLGWGEEFRYDFLKIEKSKGNIYNLSVKWAEDGKETSDGSMLDLVNSYNLEEAVIPESMATDADFVQKKYLSLAYLRRDNYPEGSAFLNNRRLEGDLAFKTYYQTNLSGFIKGTFSDLKQKAVSDRGFFVFFFLLLVFLLLLLKKHQRT